MFLAELAGQEDGPVKRIWKTSMAAPEHDRADYELGQSMERAG